MKYLPVQCKCGHQSCNDWHVAPLADVQGVSFTKIQAFIVAAILNALEKAEEES